jgi:glycosyltransferase involved in cell wall biosynthesis
MHLRYPVSTMPLRRPFHIHRRVAPELRTVEFAGPPDVAIVHLNPDSWAPLLDDDHCETIDAARCRIGAFVWESQDPPPFLAERARDLNGIWAPSRYCAAGFERAVGIPVDVVHYPVPVRLAFPDAVRVAKARADIGIAPDHRIILYSFDSSSYLVRKNPEALVRAFDRSGLCADGWRLVLKTKHLSGAGSVGAALTSAVAGCAGAVLVDRAMGSAAAGALMDAADIYVSPHAAEGFGLTIAEAMARAKPVIATDYGGSTDFLDRSCGFPVPADLWQLDHDVGPYGSGAIWARVDEDALTETLVAVANLTPVERAQIGRRAQDRVDAMLSPAAIAAEMRASIDSLLAR